MQVIDLSHLVDAHTPGDELAYAGLGRLCRRRKELVAKGRPNRATDAAALILKLRDCTAVCNAPTSNVMPVAPEDQKGESL